MRFQDYPEQEKAAGAAAAYREACIAGSFGVPFSEVCFGSDPHQGIAIYPAKTRPTPLFAFLHGGGWDRGYKETMGFMAPAFTQAGISFASIGYRLAPDHIFPAGLDDTIAALRLLFQLADEYGFDRDRFFIGGHSAGGHYAAHLAVRRDWQVEQGLPINIIKGCLPISGVYRFGEGSGLSKRPRFLGDDDRNDRAASPVLLISNPAPFLIAYGEKDFPHLIVQAEEMTKALRDANGSVDFILFAGRDHFTSHLAGGEPDGPWVNRAIAFIQLTRR